MIPVRLLPMLPSGEQEFSFEIPANPAYPGSATFSTSGPASAKFAKSGVASTSFSKTGPASASFARKTSHN